MTVDPRGQSLALTPFCLDWWLLFEEHSNNYMVGLDGLEPSTKQL